MKINGNSDIDVIPERNVNTIDSKDKEKWVIECEINQLRNEIRKDMQDYKVLWTTINIEPDNEICHLFMPHEESITAWFTDYLNEQITTNLLKLKELLWEENK